MDGVRTAATVGALVGVLALAGCGSSSSSSVAEDTPSTPDMSATSGGNPPQGPTCAHVWKKGATLAHDYSGCANGSTWVKAQVYHCSDGHRLVTYAHEYYAEPGHRITQSATTLAHDHQFQHTMAVCGA